MKTALLALATLFSGCTASYTLRTDALAGLDGYDVQASPAPRIVESVNRGPVAFDGKNLVLKVKGAKQPVRGEFLTLNVREQMLLGTLRGGREVSLALGDLRQAELTNFSPSRTVGLVLVIVAGVAAAAGAVVGMGYGLSVAARGLGGGFGGFQ